MKLSSIKHLTGEGIKNIWDNRLMSLASIGVLVSCMVLIGAAMLITFNVDRAMASVEQENVILANLNDYNSVRYSEEYLIVDNDSTSSDKTSATGKIPDSAYLVHNDEEAEAVCEEIRRIDNVKSVEFVPADEGIENVVGMIDKTQAEYIEKLAEDGENPLSSAARVTFTDISKFDETVAKIQQVEGVNSITSRRDIAKKLTSIKNAINTASYVIIGLLLIIALVIVCNTIRVTMFNRKLEISIMKAVGATNSFIRLPFIVEGVAIGIISAGITLGLLYVGYSAVINGISALSNPAPFSQYVGLFAEIFVAIGVLSGIIGSMFMINKYLKKEGSEFSALF